MQQPPLGPQPSTAVPYSPAATPVAYTAPPTNTLAVVSLATGIASYVLLPLVGALVAVITGHMARGQIQRTGEGGGAIALVGLILGYLHLALVALAIVLVLTVAGGLIAFFATQPH